ncbi:MAG: hypothetical protein DCC57_23140 [Chloroflexi bacterium]|nr:MAG: hypothetical protein DCC57_23140 [Chloroflexota bacterium]
MLQWIPPALLLSALLCIAYASLLHLWGGRSLRDLLVYIAAAAGGFAVGQLLGVLLQLPLPRIGQVHVVEASIFAWLALIGARELAGSRRVGTP